MYITYYTVQTDWTNYKSCLALLAACEHILYNAAACEQHIYQTGCIIV